jgi:hypothetical protein
LGSDAIATNPAFDGTVLHVFVASGARAFFSRTTANRQLFRRCALTGNLPSAFSTNLPLARLDDVMRRCAGLPRKKLTAFSPLRRSFVVQRKTLRFATAE